MAEVRADKAVACVGSIADGVDGKSGWNSRVMRSHCGSQVTLNVSQPRSSCPALLSGCWSQPAAASDGAGQGA